MSYITKRDLSETIVGLERYVPGDESTKELALNTTSGTTLGEPTVVVFEHDVHPDVDQHYLKALGGRLFRPTTQHSICLSSVNYVLRHKLIDQFFILDNKYLDHPDLASLIADFKPTSIRATCSHISMLIDKLRAIGKESVLKTVRVLSVCGEMVGKRFRKKFTHIMPDVHYISNYSLAEAEIFNYYDPNLEERYPDFPLRTFCCPSTKTHCIDILNPDENGFGEIVLTTPDYKNYKTGDRGKLVKPEKGDPCEQILLFEGRQNYDIVLVVGARLVLEEVERVFGLLKKHIKDFRIEVREVERNGVIMGHLTLQVVPMKDAHTLDSEHVRQTVEENLQLTPTRTLKDLIRDNIFTSSDVTCVESIPANHKTIRLVKIE